MNRSRDGPARSLLNSFTVATTPPPSATAASRVQETETSTTASESAVATPSAAGPSPYGVGSSENVDEEPRPSFVAPQPAPAPAPWAAAAGAAERSADRTDSTAPPGFLTSSWSAAWRPSTHSRRLLSATPVSNAAPGALHDARSTPFKWRSAALEVPPHTPTWQPQRLRARVGDAGGGGLETERDSSRLTPKIRYSSASSSAERPSSANSQLLTTGTLDSAPRRSSSVGGGYGSRAPRLDSTRDVVASDGGGTADGWLSNRERTVPALSSATAWQPITAAAAAGGGGGAGGEARARETPRGATGLPTLLRTRLNSVAATIGFTANHSDATETHSDPSSTTAAAAASHTRPPLSSWYAPAATPAAVSEGFQVKEDDEGLRAGGQRVASQEAWHHPHRQPQPAVSPRKSSGGGSPPVVTSETSVNDRNHSGAAVVTGPVSVGDDGCLDDDAMTAAAVAAAGPVTLAHLTLRSLTEEYNHFSSEGTVGWVGLQVHLRRHTQSTQITSLDLTCYRMRREQWSWFALDILPQLRSIEVLRLVQMQLGDDEVAELVRGSCGFAGHGGSPHVLPSSSPTLSPTAQKSPRASASAPPSSLSSPAAAHGSSAASGPPHTGAALRLLRVLDLSGNAITQRSCNHLGKMMLWMADSLEEVRLLGNALKDYGMQTLSIYVAKLNVETLQRDPELFPGALRHQLRLALRRPRTHGHPSSLESAGGAAGTAPPALGELPIGPLLLDVRDCRASARGLSDILAAASRAHRLQAVIVSHNVAGVSALLPLPAAAYQEALDVASGTRAAETEDGPSPRARTYRLGPAPRRLRLVKTPLIASGALMRRQQAAFSEVRGFAPECALSTLVFHSVPLSQTCSPVGCRELLLNVFFSCPYLDLLDLSDTFEWLLVPSEEQQGLVREASHRDAVEQRLRGPEVQRGLQMYKEDQGETEFVLESATVAGQTRLGDIFGELMAHAAYNAVVRQRVVPAAFAHLRELHLSNTGLTDAGVRGLCVSVRRDRARTGMLAGLTVLNLSDNLLTVRGCVRVVASFLLEEGDGHHPSVAHLTALALQRNAGVLEGGEEGERGGDSSSGAGFLGDPLAGYITDGAGDEAAPSRLQSHHERASDAYLREVCTAAEGAVLRRATLRSATHAATAAGDDNGGVPALTVYFSAPPSSAVGRRESREEACDAAWGGVDVNGHAARGPHHRSRLSSPYGASVPVYYAGCDERGDIFCTCPRSRFYVPRGTAVGGASSEAAPVGRTPAAGAFSQRDDIPRTAAGSGAGGGPFAKEMPPTSPPEAFPVASRRRLLSALDVPLTPSHALHGSGSSALTPPDVRLPPSLLLGGGMQARAGQAVAGTPVQHDIHLSSVSFPPPSSASAYGGAGGTKTAVSPHHWADRPPAAPPASQLFSLSVPLSSRRESTLSGTGASLGSLFMDRAESAREEEVSEETAATAAAAAVPPADTAEMAEQSVADDLAAAPRSGKRRAKIRAMRTFILSYDHPPGHLLCRALGVLLRPAPDALGEGARAALAQDLLAALQRACARAAAYPDGEDSTADDASLSSPRPAATVEAVRYLPAAVVAEASSPASSLSASAATEPHWMRFEITTNERKPRMAQRLQEVLNVSWAAQCVRFAKLLQWLRAHVVVEEERDTPPAKAAGGVAAWDPVQVVERVARAVPAVQAHLESRYGGSAATAVHAHHMDASAATASGTGAGATSASNVVTLAELHPLLWRELGLTEDSGGSGGEREEAEEVEDGTAASASVTKDNVSSMPVSTLTFRQAIDSTTTKGRAEEGERATEVPGEDMYTALSASENPSRGSNGEEKAESAEEEADGGAGVGGHAASQPLTVMKRRPEKEMPPVVDLYGDVNASMEELKATQRPSELTRRAEEDVTVTSTPEKEAGSTGRGQGTGVGMAIAALSLASPLSAKAALSDPQASAEAAGQSSKTIRRFEAISTSEDEEEDDEKATSGRGGGGTQSGGTPEKQQRQGAPSPLAAEATPSMPEGPLEVRRDDGDVLTDQLMGPPSPASDRVLRQRPVTTAATPAAEVAAGASAEAPAPFGERWPQEEKERRSISGTSAGSRGRDGTRSDSPSSPGSRQRSAAAQHSAAPPSPRYTDVEVEDDSVNTPLAPKQRAEEEKEKEKERETEDGEEDVVILSPVRVQRHPSALEGRVKTFTLSYTHQEGTAVCRAWRLLHAPVSAADAPAEAEVPPSPSFAALAQEARDCLCDDFLALLQPPDEDMKHVVLSVVLQSDGGGAATAMLQVQVQTNERRATLANRLQESTHGLRRGVPTAAGVANGGGGGGGRGGLVPLTVEQADRFYFPRLSRLLRRHQMAADTVAQLDSFLQSRPTVQSRLLRSYGSLGALVHYYHGSAMALEHELGVASWDELVRGPRPAPMAALAEAAQEASTGLAGSASRLEISSPTVANDRVMPRSHSGDVHEGEMAAADGRSSGGGGVAAADRPHRRRRSVEEADGEEAGVPLADTADPQRRSASSPLGGSRKSSGVARPLPAMVSGPLQGRPPPHPRRPPTPPHPITHSDSISFDEITEEPTSEAGPVVVLRGSTPSATARSPSTPNSRNPQYFPAGFRDGSPAPSSPAAAPGGRGRQAEAFADPSAVSPLTSASASPVMAAGRPSAQLSLEDSRSGRGGQSAEPGPPADVTLSPMPQTPQRGTRERAGGQDAPPPPPRHQPVPAPADPRAAPPHSLSSQLTGSPTPAAGKSEYERVLEGKYKRLMRVSYDGVARGSVPLDPQHQQKTVIGRGKWGTQRVELSLEWEILFVLTFEKSRTLGRSSRRAQMIVHPVGCGFECVSGDELSHQAGGGGAETSSLRSSMVNAMAAEGSGAFHPPGATASQVSRGSRNKRDGGKSAASHLIITIQRPFGPDEVGSSMSEMEKTLMAGALLTVSSASSLSKAARLLTGSATGDDGSVTSRGSAGTPNMAQDVVSQLCQRNLTLDIEMKSAKHVQEALRLLKNSIRRATQAVRKSMQNAHIPPPAQ